MFVLYDDFGKISLKNIERMKIGLVIDEETGENFDYSSSIDNNTYNQVKLTYDNKKTGKREVYIAKDTSHINEWGILQYYDKIDENVNGRTKVDALLKLYNQKSRQLQIKNAIGDIRVRGGSLIIVKMDLGDIKLQNFMLVEKVKHTFKNNEHFMDLTLRRWRIYSINFRRCKVADIIQTIKKAALDAIGNSSPTSVMYGIVTNIKPLEIQIEQKLILTSEFLILTKNVIDYEIEVSINWDTQESNINTTHTHNINGNIEVNSIIEPETQNQSINNQIINNLEIENKDIESIHEHLITGKKKITIHNALKQNEKVILLQQQGGQKFIVLDKIY